jgi:hypothetical protein
MKNNILWSNQQPFWSDAPFVESNNIFWASNGSPLILSRKNSSSMTVSPGFVDIVANNFHLQSTSLAINAGSIESVSAGFMTDLDQVAVPQQDAVDIGAYESHDPISPTATPTATSEQATATSIPAPLAPSPTPTITSVAATATPVPSTPAPLPTPITSPAPMPSATAIPLTDVPVTACSIMINDGARFTGSRAVVIKTSVAGAQMMVSNNAGFEGAAWQPYQNPVDWVLLDTGGQIASLNVYARFVDAHGTALCGGSDSSDDINYDPVSPTVSVTLAFAGQDGRQVGGPVVLEVAAADQDNGSGVEGMQISVDAEFSESAWRPYSSSVEIEAQPGQTVYVRVQDGSGNISTPAVVTVPATPDTVGSSHSVFLPLLEK